MEMGSVDCFEQLNTKNDITGNCGILSPGNYKACGARYAVVNPSTSAALCLKMLWLNKVVIITISPDHDMRLFDTTINVIDTELSSIYLPHMPRLSFRLYHHTNYYNYYCYCYYYYY